MSRFLVTSVLADNRLALEWEEDGLADSHDRHRLEKLLFCAYEQDTQAKTGLWLLVLGLSDKDIPLSPALEFWRTLAQKWVHQVRTAPNAEEKRGAPDIPLEREETSAFLLRVPPMVGVETVDAVFIVGVWNTLSDTFRTGMRGFKGTIEDYFQSLAPRPNHVDRIHFHLVENRRDEERPFAFLATYSAQVDEADGVRHQPLKMALQEFAGKKDKLLELLATVNKVAKTNSLIESLLNSGELFHPVALVPREAFTFLNGVPDFEEAGILCRIPRWWKGRPQKISVSLSIGNASPSKIGFDALLDFTAGLRMDGEAVSEEEARRILERATGLALIKGKWVAVDTESLKATLEALRKAKKISENQQVSFADAMRMLMGTESTAGGTGVPGADITCGEWLKSVLEKMTNPTLVRAVRPSPFLKAELRPYQQQGLNWLGFLHSLGFGLCLADDMGLGKTVQVLAHLQTLKAKGRASLIVVPASLMENWRREIEKFTPDLRPAIVHPQAQGVETPDDCDVVITTYGMVGRCPWLAKREWFYVICDEAQAIKNPGTKQTKSVKALKGRHRCVMTGTPVENRLTDLWSLFDFINPGLLGSFTEFKNFAKGLEKNPDGYGVALRRTVHPYILRRSKTDKTIISDLPDKVEMKTYCGLSKTQAVIYEGLVRKLDAELDLVDGIERKGLVLAYLMKCKQLCNHPDHYTGSGPFKKEESGKFKRLAELCETIREKREKVLIFTQFAEVIAPLSKYLENVFGAPGLTLSGSTSVKHRREAVDCFQNSGDYTPFFILSLKAGGVGLNLTSANHVIHFDRWWNPAVENQATDRAFRIGQKKNVMVHKFICKGTVEEKIDALIEDKKKLAGEIIPSGAETWITEMNDAQVKELFRFTPITSGEE